MSGKEANKKYRDSVFRDYFNDEERLLSLCNAILGTNYQNSEKLIINTLEGIFFDNQKNDISCVIENNFLVLIEHQTSVNNNMPFRCLSYVTELLNNLIENKDRLYHKALIQFPRPKFFVLYDGDAKEPLQREMRLSDAFGGDNSALELIVTALNINFGLPQPLLSKCQYLREYSTLVGKVKEGIRAGLTRKEAISRAVRYCLDNGLMKGYLEENSKEVFNMLALQWEQDKAIRASYEDGRDDAIESVALNLLNMGLTVEKIQEATKLSFERIKELSACI
ncbi:MAG: transposase, partial [Selenomonadaceae bacterium]|nr:transposase [Selenomonadaceae bacterium]